MKNIELQEYLIAGIQNGVVRSKKVTREFVYSANKNGIPVEMLHEHLPDFLCDSYVQTKTVNTIKNYRSYLKRWIRWVYSCEGIPLPEELQPQEQKKQNENEIELEAPYEYVVPEPVVEPDEEYLDFLRRYEEVNR